MPPGLPIRAVQYLRMSTEHQNYSLSHQSAAIAAFALANDYEIVRTYADPATSGLHLENRSGLKDLLTDVLQGGSREFSAILVYDVSRWGRFQDLDESAHYEFVCRQAGAPVIYCAEPFEGQGGIVSQIVKQLKRAMAAEYSRELSTKVSEAKRGLAQRGFWTGGECSYGYRRAVVDASGAVVRVLQEGEAKALQGYRVILVGGPAHEVAVVRRIFREYVVEGRGTVSIAAGLQADGILATGGQPWSRRRVRRLLIDEKLVGVLVSGRRKSRLRKDGGASAQDWLRRPGGCPALVSQQIFDLAQRNMRRNVRLGTDEEMLSVLRRVLAVHGRLSANLIRAEGRQSPGSFAKRFGSLSAAYQRIGYIPSRAQSAALRRRKMAQTGRAPWQVSDEELMGRLQALHVRAGKLTATLIDEAPELPAFTVVKRRLGSLPQLWAVLGCTPTSRQVRAADLAARRSRGERTPPFLWTRPLRAEPQSL